MSSLLEKIAHNIKDFHHVAVAFSAGRDSAALLHGLSMVAKSRNDLAVTAIHVHHGMQRVADDWVTFSESFVRALKLDGVDVSLDVQYINLPAGTGQSTEALARNLRYEALTKVATHKNIEAVLLGHHRKDQAETFLLQAFRGAGVAGLSAMPVQVRRSNLTWVRPWLDVSREDIETYISVNNVLYVDDPTNDQPLYARNKTRLSILPAISEQFPQAEASLAQSALWCAEANDALTHVAAADATCAIKNNAIDVSLISAWPVWRIKNLIRYWYENQTNLSLSVPALTRVLDAVTKSYSPAKIPCRQAPGILFFKNHLTVDTTPIQEYFSFPDRLVSFKSPDSVIQIEELSGHWTLAPSKHGFSLPLTLTAGQRREGLKFKKGTNQPARDIKNQFQAFDVPVEKRQGAYLYQDSNLVWAPGLGLDARFGEKAGWVPVWNEGLYIENTMSNFF